VSVRAAFRAQAEVCAAMGSPFTARLCRLVADRLAPAGAVAMRVLGWPGDPRGRADALPLRLAGALHGLVLAGADEGLAQVYPPANSDASDDALWDAIAAALETHAGMILSRLDHPPQTNEPRRSAALAPGCMVAGAQTGLPVVLSELGASAGLNLHWDRFALDLGGAVRGDPASAVRIAPKWRGPPPPGPVQIAARAACDRAPIDPSRDDDRLRLLSYIWADQRDRLARTAAAIALAAPGPRVERAEAPDWLAARLATRHQGAVHVVAHSIFWQYLPPADATRCAALLAAAGARADASAPLAWLRMEGDGENPGAAITLTLWPGGETRLLGRADFHGAWVDWKGWSTPG
jgi:hypothetical protein